MIEGDSERAELRLVPAGAQAQDQPATGDLVDRVGPLREDGRVVERRAGDKWAQLAPRRHRGQRSAPRPRLPRSPRGPVLPAVEEMLAGPHGVVAEVLERPGHV